MKSPQDPLQIETERDALRKERDELLSLLCMGAADTLRSWHALHKIAFWVPTVLFAQGDRRNVSIEEVFTLKRIAGDACAALAKPDARKTEAKEMHDKEHAAALEAMREQRDALLGNPEAVHRGALAAIEALRQGNAAVAEAEYVGKALTHARELLFRTHGWPDCIKYGDDGELQCNRCMIDFKRNSIKQIAARIFERGMERAALAQKQPGQEPEAGANFKPPEKSALEAMREEMDRIEAVAFEQSWLRANYQKHHHFCQLEVQSLREALTRITDYVWDTAKESFDTHSGTPEKDFRENDAEGFACYKNARAALAQKEPKP